MTHGSIALVTNIPAFICYNISELMCIIHLVMKNDLVDYQATFKLTFKEQSWIISVFNFSGKAAVTPMLPLIYHAKYSISKTKSNTQGIRVISGFHRGLCQSNLQIQMPDNIWSFLPAFVWCYLDDCIWKHCDGLVTEMNHTLHHVGAKYLQIWALSLCERTAEWRAKSRASTLHTSATLL